MKHSAREQLVLELAIAQGFLSAKDRPQDGDLAEPRTLEPQEARWGIHLARLLAAGRVREEDLERLAETLQVGDSPIEASAEPNSGPTASSSTGPAEESDPAGQVLPSFLHKIWDRYEFLRSLGSGGMGIVYAARDRRLGRQVALKFLLGVGDVQLQRFLQEARAQARVRHAGICEVYEVGEVEGRAYIAMQLVEGQPLNLASKMMSLQEKVQAVKDVAEALYAAHGLGIIHRDLKPANVTIERET